MQILIDLYQTDENVFHSSKEQLKRFNFFETASLIYWLKKEGYRINTLFGRLIYNHETDEVVDCGEPGSDIPIEISELFASTLFHEGKAKIMVIFVEEKYALFMSSYMVAYHFTHLRRVRPISPYQATQNFEALILKKDSALLDNLYFDSFVHTYHDGEPRPALFNQKDGKPLPKMKNESVIIFNCIFLSH